MSIVSVSRCAGRPHVGQGTSRNARCLFSGLPLPSGMRSVGRTTGRSFSGTGTTPQVSQWMMGMGVPQKRWRLMPQSRRRQVVFFSPRPAAPSTSATLSTAAR